MKIRILLFSIVFFPCIIFSQTMPQKFIEALIYDKENIADFISNDKLELSEESLAGAYSTVTFSVPSVKQTLSYLIYVI